MYRRCPLLKEFVNAPSGSGPAYTENNRDYEMEQSLSGYRSFNANGKGILLITIELKGGEVKCIKKGS